MKCHGHTILRFHLIAHHVIGVNFSQGIVFLAPASFRHIFFGPQAVTAVVHVCTKFVLCGCIRSVPKVWNDDPWPFEVPKINMHWQTVDEYCASVQVTPIRGFRFYRANIHIPTHPPTHTHTHTHIVTKWSQYPRRRSTSSAWIIISRIKQNAVGVRPIKHPEQK